MKEETKELHRQAALHATFMGKRISDMERDELLMVIGCFVAREKRDREQREGREGLRSALHRINTGT